MSEIEGSIVLPSNAAPLSRYVRVYAYRNAKTVSAVFYAPGSDIYILRESCRDDKKQMIPCGRIEFKETQIKAGDRRWIDYHEELPDVLGGGCGLIRAEYDMRTHRIAAVRCNGPY